MPLPHRLCHRPLTSFDIITRSQPSSGRQVAHARHARQLHAAMPHGTWPVLCCSRGLHGCALAALFCILHACLHASGHAIGAARVSLRRIGPKRSSPRAYPMIRALRQLFFNALTEWSKRKSLTIWAFRSDRSAPSGRLPSIAQHKQARSSTLAPCACFWHALACAIARAAHFTFPFHSVFSGAFHVPECRRCHENDQ